MPHGDHPAGAGCAGHPHHHAHHHHEPPKGFNLRFAIGAALNAVFVLAGFGAGFAAHSTALMADAVHNMGDVLGLLLAWGAATLAQSRPRHGHSYGFGRSTILAGLFNAVVLLIGIGALSVGAVQTLLHPRPVATGLVMMVAALGILVNGGTALLLMQGRHDDLNQHGAFLHMAADAMISAGVVAAGGVVAFTGWMWIDPLASLVISALLLRATWGLLRDSFNLANDAVPRRIDQNAVEAYLRALPGVHDVHDLHIWGLSTTLSAMTVHLVRPVQSGLGDDTFLATLRRDIAARFDIAHVTVQLETGADCAPCPLL